MLFIGMFYLGVRLFLFLSVDLSSRAVAYILFHFGSTCLLRWRLFFDLMLKAE